MNSISKQILRSHQFFPKLLVGTLLIYTVIGIPLFIGYLARFLQELKEHDSTALPQWNHWLALIIESWELLVVMLAYAIIPMSISWAIANAIDGWFGTFFWLPLGVLPWIPTMLLFFLCPMVASVAYSQYLYKGTFASVLNIKDIYKDILRSLEELGELTLLFWGTMFIGFPVLGFTTALCLFIYFPLVIHTVENNRYR